MLQFVVPVDRTIEIFIKPFTLDGDFKSCEVIVQNILYIERLDKDFRKVVFSTPLEFDDIKYFEAKWKCRYSLNKIISELNFDSKTTELRPFFKKISSKIIARTIFFSGRDAEWKHIQLTGVNYLDQTYKPVELQIGRDYLPEIKKIFSQFFTLKVSNNFKGDSPDVILINPVDIIYIVSKKRSKTIYLSKPFIKANKPCFELNWETTLSANKIVNRFEFIIQVNKNTLVNLYHVNNQDDFIEKKLLEINLYDKTKKISISETYINKI